MKKVRYYVAIVAGTALITGVAELELWFLCTSRYVLAVPLGICFVLSAAHACIRLASYNGHPLRSLHEYMGCGAAFIAAFPFISYILYVSAKSDGWHMPQSMEYGPLALLYLVACMLMGYGNMVSCWRWFARKWFRRDSTSIGRGKR